MAGKATLLARKTLLRPNCRRVKKAAPVSSFSLGMSMLVASSLPPLAISRMALSSAGACLGRLRVALLLVMRRLSWRGLKAVLPAAAEGKAVARRRRLMRRFMRGALVGS